MSLYQTIILTRTLPSHAAGTVGVIVEVHDDGKGFEVELADPFVVLTLTGEDFETQIF